MIILPALTIMSVLIFPLHQIESAKTTNDPEIKARLEKMIETSIEAAKEQPKQKIKNGVPAFNIPIPGIIAGYKKQGQPLRVASAGVRKWDADASVTPDDLVHIGSCTKAMTATLIGRLVDQKKLTFDTTIKEGHPELAEKIDKAYHDVTVHQLITHRAGVPRDAFWSGNPKLPIVQRRLKVVTAALKAPPKKPIDGSYAYSNLGYCIAGMIAAKTENTSWEKLIKRELFDVLKMKSASFGPPGTKGKTDQPWGHIPVGVKLVPQQGDNPATLGPAGTVHLSIADWAKFALAHAGCSDPKIVSDETMKVLHEIVKQDDNDQNNYACGWMVFQRPWARGTALTHSGSNTMWYATVWVAPNNDSVYLAAINAGINEGILKATDQAIGVLLEVHRAAYENELKIENK